MINIYKGAGGTLNTVAEGFIMARTDGSVYREVPTDAGLYINFLLAYGRDNENRRWRTVLCSLPCRSWSSDMYALVKLLRVSERITVFGILARWKRDNKHFTLNVQSIIPQGRLARLLVGKHYSKGMLEKLYEKELPEKAGQEENEIEADDGCLF